MQNRYDLKRYSVLYVDDEELALKYFDKAFGREFRVLTANNAADGLKIIEQQGDDIGILLTDQRMPGEKGVQLLEKARMLRPRLVRMLITAYADFGVTVDAVNLGSIFRYISKPLQVEDMRNTLRRAMEFYMIQQERDELLREKLSALHNMLITDRVISLGVLAAGLSHQLRNPLQAVQKFLELTPRKFRQENVDLVQLRDPAFWRDFHGLVVKQAGRIAELVGELDGAAVALAMDREIDTKSIVAGVADAYQRELTGRAMEFQREVSDSLPTLRLDPVKFQKMFELLLRCELSILPQGTRITLAVKSAPGGGPPGIQIILSDNGPGMPVESLRSVFDPFSIRTEGSQEFGLLLMSVYFLVHHLGGIISVRGTSAGLNFVIDIPALAADGATPTSSTRDFVTNVLMNDALWERLLAVE